MAIHETKRQSDLEKRLQLLRRQVYGKNQSSAVSYQLSDKNQKKFDPLREASDRRLTTDRHSVADLTYLHQDLLKILTLSGLAIGAQLILFFLLKNRILNLNFF